MIKNLNFDNVDSGEEIYMKWYIQELIDAGYAEDAFYKSHSFSLCNSEKIEWFKRLVKKVSRKEAAILREHKYTSDFSIIWTPKARDIFYFPLGSLKPYKKNPVSNKVFIANILPHDKEKRAITILDVKGEFVGSVASRSKSVVEFSINSKWVFQKFGVYIEKVIVPSIFWKTFTPERYLLTDRTLKPRKIKEKVLSLQEFVSKRRNDIENIC